MKRIQREIFIIARIDTRFVFRTWVLRSVDGVTRESGLRIFRRGSMARMSEKELYDVNETGTSASS